MCLRGAVSYGLRNPPVRWVMLASVFMDGVSIYAFYAMQPYLLQLYGDPQAYGIAGTGRSNCRRRADRRGTPRSTSPPLLRSAHVGAVRRRFCQRDRSGLQWG